MIDAARWQALSALFDEALALPDAARAGWLAALRERDADLAAAAQRMLSQLEAEADDAVTAPALAFDGLLRRAMLGVAAQATVLPGQRLGAWELQSPIGEGGMGQVWLAHRCDGLYVASAAIKLLRSDFQQASQQAHLLARFARERAALARLNHPGIAKLLDAGVDGGQAYLVLEHVSGRTLAEHIDAACSTVASRVRLLLAVADAVAHAHGHLIVHRDIKPSNLMFTPDGTPKLLDFGIAVLLDGDDEADSGLTRQNGRVLTLGYAAPELITGAPAGVAADVFSLGVVLYEMLAGCLPFAVAGGSRSAQEHAVLHTEPRRLMDASAAHRTDHGRRGGFSNSARPGTRDRRESGEPGGSGLEVTPPTDIARARGDLEAIIAKTLRKDPAERYGSVPALAEDLRRWLQSRPVSARRDNRRHAAALWLRRHALAAGLGAGLTVALSAGLLATTWQWQRAQTAVKQADHVTDYLGGLLASANPDVNQGRSPNVLELLDKSRLELADKFSDEPEVRLRLLEVLAKTYNDLNRYDLAAPLAQQWVALARERYGADDPRTLRARLAQARTNVPMGPWESVVGWLEPLQPTVERVFGGQSTEMHGLLVALANSEIRMGRMDAAERHLEQARLVGLRLFDAGSFERVFHHNYLSGLYAARGRMRLALQELKKAADQQRAPPPDMQRFALTMRSNMLTMQIRLADYAHVEEQVRSLLQDSERVLGPGNALSAKMHAELARYHLDRGNFAAALAERESLLTAGASGTPPAVQLATRAAVLLDRCLLQQRQQRQQRQPRPPAALLREAELLRAALDKSGAALGNMGAEARIALARCGLLLGHDGLVAKALAGLRSDPGLAHSTWLVPRVAQLDGEWQRARGDLAASRRLLGQRVTALERSPDRGVPTLWSARLDLAYTLVLLHDPGAAAAVEAAAAERPRQMPEGHPLDTVQGYLVALLQQGQQQQGQQRKQGASAAAAATARARQAVERAYGRKADDGTAGGALRLGGMFG